MSSDARTPGTAQEGIDAVRNGWFTELSTMWPGQGLSFQIKEELFRGRSKFQVPRETTKGVVLHTQRYHLCITFAHIIDLCPQTGCGSVQNRSIWQCAGARRYVLLTCE